LDETNAPSAWFASQPQVDLRRTITQTVLDVPVCTPVSAGERRKIRGFWRARR